MTRRTLTHSDVLFAILAALVLLLIAVSGNCVGVMR